MKKLVQKVNWDLPNSPTHQLYMYGEASVEANQVMQEPLEKLYRYENQPNIREIIKEYIGELDTEIKRCENELQKYYKNNGDIGVIHMQSRIKTLKEVRYNLQSKSEEEEVL